MASDTDKKMKNSYSMAEVSKILRLKKSDLRAIEEEGLFFYSDKSRSKVDKKNFERLKLVVSLQRDLGVNLPGVDVILHMRDKMKKLHQDFNYFLVHVRKHLEQQAGQNIKKIRKSNAS